MQLLSSKWIFKQTELCHKESKHMTKGRDELTLRYQAVVTEYQGEQEVSIHEVSVDPVTDKVEYLLDTHPVSVTASSIEEILVMLQQMHTDARKHGVLNMGDLEEGVTNDPADAPEPDFRNKLYGDDEDALAEFIEDAATHYEEDESKVLDMVDFIELNR